jgi:hypothetical protein
VPIDFLSPGQLASYGRYGEPPSAAQLERFFHFDERDRTLIARRRGDHNRLGFAVQLGTVRFLGTFLPRPTEVPEIVTRRVAEELAVEDPGRLAEYGRRDPTHREHAGEIQREYGYRDFSDASARADLLGWLDARAWATAERPSVLFDLATARLVEGKVLLPGATVLVRAVTAARDRAASRLYRSLFEAAAAHHGPSFEQLLDVPEGDQLSRWEDLRAGPRKLTANEVAESFERLAAVRAVGVGHLTVDVPPGRLRALARYGLSAKAQTLRRLSPQRRTATLLAAVWQLELDATDDALILLDQVTDLLLSQATREHKDRRYKQLPELDRAAARCGPPCSSCSTRHPEGSKSCGARSTPTFPAASLNSPPTRCTASPRSPIRRTDRTPRSARSCCAATKASDASCPTCSRPSRSRPRPEDKRSSTRWNRYGRWRAALAASAPRRCR